MRRTESAEELFVQAQQHFQFMGRDPSHPTEVDVREWLAGMRALSIGLSDLAVAVRDIYDKLESMSPRGRIVGTLERKPAQH